MVYSEPIVINTATTIKAIAIKGDDVSSVVTATYTISVTAPGYNLASSGYYLEGTELTLTSAGNTIYYNITTNGDTPDNPTSASTEYTGTIALSSGTVKVKAIAYDAYGNTSTVASRTVNGVAPATLPFNWAGGAKSTFLNLTGVVGYSLGDYTITDSNRLYLIKLDGTGDYIEIFMNDRPLNVSVGVKMIGGNSASKIKFQESTNGVTFTDVEELSISGSQNDVVNLTTTKAFASTTRVIKLLFTKGSNVGVGPVKIAGGSVPATLTAAGWATLYTPFALDFSGVAGLTAYTATLSDNTVTLTAVNDVPANTGVVLRGAEDAYNIPVITSSSTAKGDLQGNATESTAYNAVTGKDLYMLALNGDNEAQFTKVTSGSIAAGKAYLAVTQSGGVKAFNVVFGEEDAIESVKANGQRTLENVAIYNLAGQRMSKMQRGINIVNGKKYFVKLSTLT